MLTYPPRHEKTNLSSGFSTRYDSNWPSQLQKLARVIKLHIKKLRDIILSRQRTRMLIRLRRCAACVFVVCIWHKQVLS